MFLEIGDAHGPLATGSKIQQVGRCSNANFSEK